MAFRIVGDGGNCISFCRWIAAEGNIEEDTGTKFREFITREDAKGYASGEDFYVVLNSKGGSVLGGLELGREIRQLGFSTTVGHTVPLEDDPKHFGHEDGLCASACAYAFLGGVRRAASTKQIGVHQFYTLEAMKDPTKPIFTGEDAISNQAVVGMLALYIHSMGAKPELLFIASRTDPRKMTYLTEEQMIKMNVITDKEDEMNFTGWAIEPSGRGAVAVGKTASGKGETEELSFYCRKKKPNAVYALLAVHLGRGDYTLEELRSTVNAVDITVVEAKKGNEEPKRLERTAFRDQIESVRRAEDGRALITLELVPNERAALDTAKSMYLDIMLPRAAGAMFAGTGVDLESGRAHLDLAFRNCL